MPSYKVDSSNFGSTVKIPSFSFLLFIFTLLFLTCILLNLLFPGIESHFGQLAKCSFAYISKLDYLGIKHLCHLYPGFLLLFFVSSLWGISLVISITMWWRRYGKGSWDLNLLWKWLESNYISETKSNMQILFIQTKISHELLKIDDRSFICKKLFSKFYFVSKASQTCNKGKPCWTKYKFLENKGAYFFWMPIY